MIYAVADLHGYPLEKFIDKLKEINFSEDDICFVLGDVIDRGKDGIRLLKWIMSHPGMRMIMGNHEKMMLESEFIFSEITDESIAELSGEKLSAYSNWMANGGSVTLEALRKESPDTIKSIFDFIRELPLFDAVSTEENDYILTHSGLGNFSKTKRLSQYSEDELLWNRPHIDTKYFDNGIITVFGHTPTINYGKEYENRIIVTPTWMNIDTGAGYGFEPAIVRLK